MSDFSLGALLYFVILVVRPPAAHPCMSINYDVINEYL